MGLLSAVIAIWIGGALAAIIGLRLLNGSAAEQAALIRQIHAARERSQENCRLTLETVTWVEVLRDCGKLGRAFNLRASLADLETQAESLSRELDCLSDGFSTMRVSELRQHLKALSELEAETAQLFWTARLLVRQYARAEHAIGGLGLEGSDEERGKCVSPVSAVRGPVLVHSGELHRPDARH